MPKYCSFEKFSFNNRKELITVPVMTLVDHEYYFLYGQLFCKIIEAL